MPEGPLRHAITEEGVMEFVRQVRARSEELQSHAHDTTNEERSETVPQSEDSRSREYVRHGETFYPRDARLVRDDHEGAMRIGMRRFVVDPETEAIHPECLNCGLQSEFDTGIDGQDHRLTDHGREDGARLFVWFCADCMYNTVTCGVCQVPFTMPEDERDDAMVGYMTLCPEHRGRFGMCRRCEGIHELDSLDTVPGHGDALYCSYCREDARPCEWPGCEAILLRHDTNDFNGAVYCRNHLREARHAMTARSVSHSGFLSASGDRASLGFGTEIEVEFDDGPPFRVGGYHSDAPAPREFFGGWKCEGDGSLRFGAELISPVLEGSGGVAEVIATFERLKGFGGKMLQSCGGHVTVGVPGPKIALQAQRVFTVMEEVAFATTGSYNRYRRGSYAHPLKREVGGYYDDLMQGRASTDKFLSCHNKGDAVEFRYPPGTLVPEQFAINLAFGQLVVKMAVNLSDDDISELIHHGHTMWGDAHLGSYQSPEKVHHFVLFGLGVLNQQGWKDGGSFAGLPYPATKPRRVRVRDANRGHDQTVWLPTRDRILARLERQLGRFYQQMWRDNPTRRDEMLGEAMSLVRDEPTERVKEVIATGKKTPLMRGIKVRADAHDDYQVRDMEIARERLARSSNHDRRIRR